MLLLYPYGYNPYWYIPKVPTKIDGTNEERLALDVFIKLNRATAAVNRSVHQPLRGAGLTEIQFGILDSLYFGGPLSVSGLAEKNLCTQNSISTVVDTMERNGLALPASAASCA